MITTLSVRVSNKFPASSTELTFITSDGLTAHCGKQSPATSCCFVSLSFSPNLLISHPSRISRSLWELGLSQVKTQTSCTFTRSKEQEPARIKWMFWNASLFNFGSTAWSETFSQTASVSIDITCQKASVKMRLAQRSSAQCETSTRCTLLAVFFCLSCQWGLLNIGQATVQSVSAYSSTFYR